MSSLKRSLKLFILLGNLLAVNAFVPTSLQNHNTRAQQKQSSSPILPTYPTSPLVSTTTGSRSTQLYSFLGSDGGILGVGAPEVFTILLVGYFVLGPSDLYKVVKEIGKFVTQLQTFSKDATMTIEQNLESQLQVEEIRKAQRELNDAFSFRRSVNVDPEADAFSTNVQSDRVGIKEGETDIKVVPEAAAGVAGEGATTATKKKIRRRVKKKKVSAEEEAPEFNMETMAPTNQQPLANNVPDLAMETAEESLGDADARAMKAMEEANEQLRKEMEEEEAAKRRQERIERLSGGQPTEDSLAQQEMAASGGQYDTSLMSPSDEQSRFQAQLSGNWNEDILSKGEELEPLAKLMEQLALLEDEKNANDARLQEEFRLREENEEKFYREKRRLLEEAAAMVQAEAYGATTTPPEGPVSTPVNSSN